MASFTEQATLVVRDQSTAKIKKINAALAQLMKTAKSFKASVKVDINTDKLLTASAAVRRLTRDLNALRTAASRINLNINTGNIVAVQRHLNAIRTMGSTPVRLSVMATSNLPQLTAQLAALRAQAGRPIRGGPIGPGGGGGGRGGGGAGGGGGGGGRGGGGGGIGPILTPRAGVMVISGVVGIAGYSIAAMAHALGRTIKEGVNDSDIAGTAIAMKQLPKDQENAVIKAASELTKEQAQTPSGGLLNVAQIQRLLAEMLPVAKGDVEGAKTLARETITMIKQEFAMGRNLKESLEGAYNYGKAIEQLGTIFDKEGKLIPAKAEEWYGIMRQIAPDIGREFTGQFARQAVKYAGSARYGMDARALMGLLFMGEEFNPSAAGTKMRELSRSLAGVRISKQAAAEMARLGLLTPKEAKWGKVGEKDVKEIVGGTSLDPELLQQNVFDFVTRRVLPAYERDAARRGKTNLDQTAQAIDMATFARNIGFAANAADLLATAMIKAKELNVQIDQAMARRGDRATVEQAMSESSRIAGQGVVNQIQSTFGEAISALEPITLPLMKGLSSVLKDAAVSIKGAGEGDPIAISKITAAMLATVAASPALRSATGVIGTLAQPAGVVAALAGMADPLTRPLSMAALALQGAAASLTGSATALTAAAAAQAGGGLMGAARAAGRFAASPFGLAAGVAATVGWEYYKTYNDKTDEQIDRFEQQSKRLAELVLQRQQTQHTLGQARAAGDSESSVASLVDRIRRMTAEISQLDSWIEDFKSGRISRPKPVASGFGDITQPVKPETLTQFQDLMRTLQAQPPIDVSKLETVAAQLTEAGNGFATNMMLPAQQITQAGSTLSAGLSASVTEFTGAIPLFQSAFGEGATAIGNAGTTAANALTSAAPSIGATIGNAAAAAIQARVSNMNINVNANVKSMSNAGGDTGSQKAVE